MDAHFIYRRLHSLTGIVPVGLFLIYHLYIQLCEVVREKNGVYITHLRDVNVERGFAGGGIPEALEIGRRSVC